MALVRHGALTWTEAEALGTREDVIALIPVGAIEQHGPHLPMIMDTALARELSTRVAEGADRTVMVMETIPVGLSDHHVGFPGTITVTAPVLEGLFEGYIQAAERMGIRTIVLLSGHGGNFSFIGRLARERSSRQPETTVIAYDDLQRLIDVAHREGIAAGSPMVASDAHAGLMETSIALQIFAGSVRDFAQVRGYDDPQPDWTQIFTDGVRSVSGSGVLGAPQGSTAQFGERVLQALTEDILEWMDGALASTT